MTFKIKQPETNTLKTWQEQIKIVVFPLFMKHKQNEIVCKRRLLHDSEH